MTKVIKSRVRVDNRRYKSNGGYSADNGSVAFRKDPPEEFRTEHNLTFESAHWNGNIQAFRVGTVHGQWWAMDAAYVILSLINDQPGNGHLNDVFQWFENSCKRDRKQLVILEFMNDRFKKHCKEKRGFTDFQEDSLIKFFL
jgi:hypothetical protein